MKTFDPLNPTHLHLSWKTLGHLKTYLYLHWPLISCYYFDWWKQLKSVHQSVIYMRVIKKSSNIDPGHLKAMKQHFACGATLSEGENAVACLT